jgi:hypothetical protein
MCELDRLQNQLGGNHAFSVKPCRSRATPSSAIVFSKDGNGESRQREIDAAKRGETGLRGILSQRTQSSDTEVTESWPTSYDRPRAPARGRQTSKVDLRAVC